MSRTNLSLNLLSLLSINNFEIVDNMEFIHDDKYN